MGCGGKGGVHEEQEGGLGCSFDVFGAVFCESYVTVMLLHGRASSFNASHTKPSGFPFEDLFPGPKSRRHVVLGSKICGYIEDGITDRAKHTPCRTICAPRDSF